MRQEDHMMRLVLVCGVVLAVLGCATAAGPDAPWIGPLKFSPPSFSIGQIVKLSFEYRNIHGGLSKSEVDLDYKDSLPNHTRKASTFAELVKVLGSASENGVFETELRPSPSDPPPFDITYFRQVKDANGRRSNEATGTVTYRRL
jgi:hypothetical protein